MTVQRPSLSSGVAKAKDPERKKKEKVYNPAATPGRRGKRGLTIYLYPETHADLKAIAEDEDKQLKDLLEEGVNLVLQRYGKKPIA